jgi:AraC-like DNA-binding protein
MRADNASAVPNRVLPDGASDIIIGLGDVAGPVAVGTMRTAAVYALEGAVDYFGVRFRAGCGLPFLDVPMREITDCRVPLDSLWGADADRMAGAPANERVWRMTRILDDRLRRWTPDTRSDESLVERAVAMMRRVRGGVGVGQLAAAIGVGERRLERAFDRSVGVGPKLFMRILRLRRAVRTIDACTRERRVPAWTSVAFDAGYADQPHLIREFNALAGTTPAGYAAERNGVGFVQYDEGADV